MSAFEGTPLISADVINGSPLLEVLEVPLAISFLLGSKVAVVSAHQPAELPRKCLTKPWD